MRVRMLMSWIVTTLLLVLWMAPAQAIQIESTRFSADASVVDFEGSSAALPGVPGLQFVREGGSSDPDNWFAGGASGHNGELFGGRALSGLAFRGHFSSVGVVFDEAVEAAGAWVAGVANSRFGSADSLTISAFDAAGNLLDRVEIDLDLEAVFVGFASEAGIARLDWVGDDEGYFGVDDLTSGAALIPNPEPGTAALLGFGLVAVATARRRNR